MRWVYWLYEQVWRRTTGEPWTTIMRRHRWLLPLFAVPLVVWAGWHLGERPLGRVILILLVGLAGVVAGHVYWPE